MSSISNRFFITTIDDGVTLHGSLSSTKAISQAWDNGSCTPDWSINANQPTIYLTLMSGSTPVTTENVSWLYNGNAITFDPNTNISTSPAGRFQKTTILKNTLNVPALKIINNLASSSNVDLDTIEIQGTYEIGGANVEFSASVQVRITSIGEKGYFGVIDFADGISNFTSENDEITMYGKLYSSGSNSEIPAGSNNYTISWYVNDVRVTDQSKITTYLSHSALTLSAGDIVDNAIIRADFIEYNTLNVLYSSYVSIDDLTDPEYMYIQYNGANGNTATLRSGQQVEFDIWVGKQDDLNVVQSYRYYYLKVLNSSGNVVLGNIPGITGVESTDPTNPLYGYRSLPRGINYHASVTLTFDVVKTLGGNVTGILLATSQVSE